MSEKRREDRLYHLLPAVYRARDDGDLKGYLAAFDGVLNLVEDAIEQKLSDAFPDSAQGWVLPYLAELFDLQLVSPDDAGRRKEIMSALAWRKRRGTRAAALHAVTSIGPSSVEIVEGYRRVLRTPRVDERLTGASPMGTVDLRRRSRRAVAQKGAPPEQLHPHGVPVFQGSVEDVSRRTPDVRAPSWNRGHIHPRRVLVYAAPFPGLFPPGWESEDVTIDLSDGEEHAHVGRVFGTLTIKPGPGTLRLTRCAVKEMIGEPGDGPNMPLAGPDVTATDCLFGSIEAPQHHAKLVGVTVLGDARAARIWASDSLFAGQTTWHTAGIRFRYCRVPPHVLGISGGIGAKVHVHRCLDDDPIFWSADWGERGAGVLHPACPKRIKEGAEDGGEVGAHHHLRYAVRERAVLEKLREELPVGQLAALIPDERVAAEPPVKKPPSIP